MTKSWKHWSDIIHGTQYLDSGVPQVVEKPFRLLYVLHVYCYIPVIITVP